MLRVLTITYGMQIIIRKSICSFIPGMESMWKPGGLRRIREENREELEDIIQESSAYKIKMENILCKTDIKEKGHLPIYKLLWSVIAYYL